MKIGELADLTGTQVETIRYYEREGLLPAPARSEGNFRIYADEHAQRLSFIRHCRSLDMTLDEIRQLLRFKDSPDEDCGDVNRLLDAHIGHVADRIRELRGLEKQLKALRQRCHSEQDAAHCGILNALSRPMNEDPGQGPAQVGRHVGGAR
ncbi:Cd(II)/Pb(II)-responsive transcriptional regulator [Lacisediminimonas profundi]|uniref:Cd(II)/Pb(II)-responsive transcriptional regulator n=1 Tax=Lacisediminimonas profundi TaxID=2603856 RepID=UPI00124B7D92|nr:Cd(II)/Pb(II)-responsive transcriptional regulator [Lacisediminimonas profundi]